MIQSKFFRAISIALKSLFVTALLFVSLPRTAEPSSRFILIENFVTFYTLWMKNLDRYAVRENFDEKSLVLTLYDQNGVTIAKGKAEKNDQGFLFQGQWTRFYESGEVLAKLRYKDGRISGRAEGFYKNHKRALLTSYTNNYQHGECLRYDSSGLLLDRIIYEADNIKEYDIKIVLVPSFQRPSSIRNGSNFDQEQSVWIFRDKENSQIQMWYINGEPYCELGATAVGSDREKYDGLAIYWHKNGNRFKEGIYKNGKEYGTWMLYDTEGKFLKKLTYRHGIEVKD